MLFTPYVNAFLECELKGSQPDCSYVFGSETTGAGSMCTCPLPGVQFDLCEVEIDEIGRYFTYDWTQTDTTARICTAPTVSDCVDPLSFTWSQLLAFLVYLAVGMKWMLD